MQKKKIITRIRQYLHGLAICLRLQNCRDFTIIREKYKCGSTVISFSQKLFQETLITKTMVSIFYA